MEKNEAEAGVTPPFAEPLRVLIVDDNIDMAETLALLVESWGYSPIVIHEGGSAVSKAREEKPHVVVLDIGLPGKNGYEIARELRQDPCLADVLIVGLSGYGQRADRERSQEAGFDHHLVKPAEPESLRQILQAVVARGPGAHA